MRHLYICLLGLVVLVLIPGTGRSQESASIAGTVSDDSGAVIPGVSVVLALAEATTPDVQLEVTDGAGVFRFQDLAPGSYRLELTLPGFEPKTVIATAETSEAPSTSPSLQVTLSLASLSEVVTVRDDVELVDVRQSSGEAEVKAPVLQAAPLPTERFQDALPLLPGVVRGPDGLINVNGARSAQSSFLLNGANVTDPVTGDFALQLPLEAVDSVKVYQNVYSAEFGQVSSGTTNVVTRGGQDKWKLSFNNFFPRFRFIGTQIQGVDKATPRFRVSGPLSKGKLWISQAFNYRFVRSRVDELPDRRNEEILESFDSVTQIDYQINRRNYLTGIVTVFPSGVDNLGINTLQPINASPDLKTRGFNVALSERASFGQHSLLETQLSLQSFDLSLRPKSDRTSLLTVRGLANNYFNAFDRDSTRVELRQSYATTLDRLGGEHTVKVGYGFTHTTYEGFDAGLPVDLLRGDRTRFQRIAWVGDTGVGATNNEVAVFVQDRVRVSPALQLDLGVRYDREQIVGENNFAPRVGVSVSPFGNDDTVVKAGVGVFYDKVFLNVRDFETRQRRQVTLFGADGLTPLGAPLEFENVLDRDNLRVPRSVNWHVEMDRLLSERFMVRVRYSERRGSNAFVVDPVVTDGGDAELRLTTTGRSRSRELELTGRARFGKTEVLASYVRAKTEADLNDFATLYGNLRQPVILKNEFSLQPFDYRNRFLVWGVVYLPKKIIWSPVLEVHTGFPYTVIDERQQVVGERNRGGRFPTLMTFDTRLTKEVSLGVRGLHALVGFQLFNLFNHFNPRDVQNNLASATFGEFANSVGTQIRLKFTLLF